MISADAITLRGLIVEPDSADTVLCHAHLTVDQQNRELEASAPGPIGAMSEMLHHLGAGVDIKTLYHQPDGAHTAAYVLCERRGQQCWAYGRAATGDEATVLALISAANQLTGRVA